MWGPPFPCKEKVSGFTFTVSLDTSYFTLHREVNASPACSQAVMCWGLLVGMLG